LGDSGKEAGLMPPLSQQIIALFILAIPAASVAWTVTHEEIFREPREWCAKKSQACQSFVERKFFYLVTCEFCFSHYVTVALLFITHYKLLFPDWRGYLVSGFSLVWVANLYMSIFGRLRLEIKRERVEIEEVERENTAQGPARDSMTDRKR
jgi:hypothetical protein